MEDKRYTSRMQNKDFINKRMYRGSNFNPQSKADKDTEVTVFCPAGHHLYSDINVGTLYNRGITPTAAQWGERNLGIMLTLTQYGMVKKVCKGCN